MAWQEITAGLEPLHRQLWGAGVAAKVVLADRNDVVSAPGAWRQVGTERIDRETEEFPVTGHEDVHVEIFGHRGKKECEAPCGVAGPRSSASAVRDTIARQLGFAIERRRAEDARQLLLDESQHRIKNTLATVQAMVGLTLRRCPAEEREAFIARLRALNEAHDLLTRQNWHRAQIKDVVSRAVKPFETAQEGRFVVEGPPLWVPAQSSLPLTMCLHELATNAAKYGALSKGTGRVHIAWDVADGGKVKLVWRETGGPPVSRPTSKGFGSRLIDATFGDGETCLDFRADGLRCSLELPLHD